MSLALIVALVFLGYALFVIFVVRACQWHAKGERDAAAAFRRRQKSRRAGQARRP